MFPRLFFVLSFLFLATTPLTPFAQAQSSFGRVEQRAPRNAHEWGEQTRVHLLRALRRSDTALNTVGGNRSHSVVLIITILRDGSVSDVQLASSTATPAMNAALVRRFKQIKGIPAFTPDMAVSSITLPLPIGTRRG